MFSLKNKAILVTGATGYLGRAICKDLAKNEANIAICSTNQKKADIFVNELGGISNSLYKGYEIDLNKLKNIPALIEKVANDFGKIDCLINNAHFGEKCTIVDVTKENWGKGLNGTITSTVFMVKYCSKYLEKTKGNIINISSIYGIVSPNPDVYIDESPNPMNYGIGKAAIIQYTKYAAVHLAKKNIRVNAISPGPFPNEKTQKNKKFIKNLSKKVPLNRIGKPSEISGAVSFLASDAASYITGHNLIIDGGWTIW